MFRPTLDKAEAFLENVTIRTEKNGDKDVPAMTLKISATLPKEFLKNFTPTLQGEMFEKDKEDLTGATFVIRDRLCVYPQKRDEEVRGASARIEIGISALPAMEFADVTLDDFSLDPLDGGFVATKFNIGIVGHGKYLERLYDLQKQAITLSVQPPELPKIGDAAANDDKSRKAA